MKFFSYIFFLCLILALFSSVLSAPKPEGDSEQQQDDGFEEEQEAEVEPYEN